VPAGWTPYRIKDITTFVSRGLAASYAEEDTGVIAFGQKCVRSDHTVDPSVGRPALSDPEFLGSEARLRPDDIVINSTGTGTLGRVGILASADLSSAVALVADGHVTVVRANPDRVLPRFLWYLLGTQGFYEIANACLAVGSTNQMELGREPIRRLGVAIPEMHEQQEIVEFLDGEVARIGCLIEEQQHQEGFLAERARTFMREMVTGRAGYSGPQHDVGPYWLGPVPQSWTPQKVAWRFFTGSGTTPSTTNRDFYGGPYPWVTTSELRENVVTETAKSVTDEALTAYPALRFYPVGSLVVAMYGATIGRVGLLGIPSTVNQACCVLHGPTTVLPKFAFFWLWAHRGELAALGEGGGQPNINQDTIRGLRIPAPTVAEQVEISGRIQGELDSANELTAEMQEQISHLVEHREALITAAVGGGLHATGRAA
jgi:restriction endonuclease S subunit